MFTKATRKQNFLKIGIDGPSGAGKTYSGLLLAKGIGGKIAVIDTERGSSANYDNIADFDFVVMHPPFSPDKYVAAIIAAIEAEYDVLVIDSLSHEWNGPGGILEQKEKYDAAHPGSNSYTNWRKFTDMHQNFTQTILNAKIHIIGTMRSKMEYVIEENDRGKKVPKKVGLAPIQGKEMEYEFDVLFDIVRDRNIASASKDRTNLFGDDAFTITEATGHQLAQWQLGGEVASEPVGVDNNEFEMVCESLRSSKKDGTLDKEWLALLGSVKKPTAFQGRLTKEQIDKLRAVKAEGAK